MNETRPFVVSYVVPGPPPRRVYENGVVMAENHAKAVEMAQGHPRCKKFGGLWKLWEAVEESEFLAERARLERDVHYRGH